MHSLLAAIHPTELTWLQAVAQYRTPELDFLFRALRLFDTYPFAALLVLVVWFTSSRRIAFALACSWILGTILCDVLKLLVASPRPEALIPGLGLVATSPFSWPSQSATSATLLLCVLFATVPRHLWRGLGLLTYVLVLYTPLYLGVHYPSDLAAGAVLGCCMGWVFARIRSLLVRKDS